MNLYEQKAAKESELVALKGAIESGDETAIKEGAEIAEALEAINASIAEAETAKAALEAIGTDEEESDVPMEETPKSLGEFAVKSFGEMHRGSAINVVAPGYKANTDVHLTTDVVDYDKRVTDIQPHKPTIRDLLSSETISGNALTYYVMGTTEAPDGGLFAQENNKKPQIHVPYNPVTAELVKAAAFLKETDELVEDAPWLKSAIDNRLITELERTIDLITANAFMSASGIGTDTWAQGGDAQAVADKVLEAAMTIEQTTGHACNGVVMTPDIYSMLRLGKDAEHRYFGGGYWGEQSVATLWGMPVVTASLPAAAGSLVIVGDFSTASFVSNTNGIQVSMTNSNEDDFIYNRVTVRAERRVAVAIRMPQAFTILQEAQ